MGLHVSCQVSSVGNECSTDFAECLLLMTLLVLCDVRSRKALATITTGHNNAVIVASGSMLL